MLLLAFSEIWRLLHFHKAAGLGAGAVWVSALRVRCSAPRLLRSFELLGAPIGNEAFTASHVAARVDKAATLLEAGGELEDPQVGLRLLRSCAGHVRLVHSMRCAPPGAQSHGFQAFDALVRSSFGALTSIHLDDGPREGLPWLASASAPQLRMLQPPTLLRSAAAGTCVPSWTGRFLTLSCLPTCCRGG